MTPYIICCLLLKCLTVRWFCGLHIHIKFHWPKLHVMEGMLYHIALPISLVLLHNLHVQACFVLEYLTVILID